MTTRYQATWSPDRPEPVEGSIWPVVVEFIASLAVFAGVILAIVFVVFFLGYNGPAPK